jgi:hypothetical protein
MFLLFLGGECLYAQVYLGQVVARVLKGENSVADFNERHKIL